MDFPLGLDSRSRGREGNQAGPKTRRLGSVAPEPCGRAKTTCLWRHQVAERRTTVARPDRAFRASHSKWGGFPLPDGTFYTP